MTNAVVFSGISALFLAAGLLLFVRPSWALSLFFAGLVVFPSGNAYADVNYKFGLYAADFFLVFGLTYVLLNAAWGRALDVKPASHYFLFILAVYASYFAFTTLVHGFPDKLGLKDLRPLIVCIHSIVLLQLLRWHWNYLDHTFIDRLAIAAAAANAIAFLAIFWGYYGIDDPFYVANAYRYVGVGTFLAVAHIIWRCSERFSWSALSVVAASASLASLLLSNSRMLVASTLAAILLINLDKVLRLLPLLVATLAVVVGFLVASHHFDAYRVIEGLYADALLEQLATRFFPFYEVFSQMNPLHMVFGLGIGTSFEIPWFVYRGLDPISVSIDNAYLTYFAKFGLLGQILLLYQARLIYFTYERVPLRLGAATFLGLAFFTMALFYELHVLGLVAMLALLRALLESSKPQRANAA